MDAVIADGGDVVIKNALASERLYGEHGLFPEEVPSVEAIRKKAPADRAAILKYCADYEAAHADGSPLPEAPKGLGYGGRLFCPDIKSQRDSLRECVARQRSARTLMEALAFRAENGRYPKGNEIAVREDPFRPGKPMTYTHDRVKARLGVYTTWRRPTKGDEEPSRVGYWIELRGKQD